MRVEVVESLPVQDEVASRVVDDTGVDRALRSFFAAIESDNSLFSCEALGARLAGGSLIGTSGVGPSGVGTSGAELCSGDFVLRFRGENPGRSRRLHFSLVEKLVELLKEAGSADSLAARICLTSDSGGETKASGFALRLRLEARGNSPEQAGLRWGLGVAHVQQALLFTSRYLRQQMAQSAD